MAKNIRAVMAGLLLGASVGSVAVAGGCISAEERRALSVADCVARLALSLPQRDLPRHPNEVTGEDLLLAIQVVDGVRMCRHGSALFTADGGF